MAWHLIDVLIEACCVSGGWKLKLSPPRAPNKHSCLISIPSSNGTAEQRKAII